MLFYVCDIMNIVGWKGLQYCAQTVKEINTHVNLNIFSVPFADKVSNMFVQTVQDSIEPRQQFCVCVCVHMRLPARQCTHASIPQLIVL